MKNNILTYYVDLRNEIDDLQYRIRILEQLPVKLRNSETMQTLRREYHELYEKAIKEQNRIERMIDKLDPLEKLLIRYKYFDRLTWPGVALKLNYSKAQVQRIHTNILNKLMN